MTLVIDRLPKCFVIIYKWCRGLGTPSPPDEACMSNSLLNGIVILIGLATYILLPVICVVFGFAIETFRRYRESRILRCPETGSTATVGIDAYRAALTSVVEKPRLRAKNCSLWPGRKACGQGCLRLPLPKTQASFYLTALPPS